jgi:hypothetical protein
VDVGDVDLWLARRPDRSDHLPLCDAVVDGDRDRPEMEERHGVPLRRSDRHRAAVERQQAGERHAASRRGAHDRVGVSADVDPRVAVLAVLLAPELEAAQDRAFDRPRPRAGR